ncbi:hypothetical protein D3C85_1930490 [compost metagenome]
MRDLNVYVFQNVSQALKARFEHVEHFIAYKVIWPGRSWCGAAEPIELGVALF